MQTYPMKKYWLTFVSSSGKHRTNGTYMRARGGGGQSRNTGRTTRGGTCASVYCRLATPQNVPMRSLHMSTSGGGGDCAVDGNSGQDARHMVGELHESGNTRQARHCHCAHIIAPPKDDVADHQAPAENRKGAQHQSTTKT